MRLKKFTAVLTASLLVLPSFLTSATSGQSESASKQEGAYSEKHEVVYTRLDPSGQQEDMYVVNSFNISEPGSIVDYGAYTSVKNLTDLSAINKNNEQINITTDEGQFYYQGTLENKALPWDIQVTYQLNGKTISPDELLGQNGNVDIRIDVQKNQTSEANFFENYLVQISVPLSSEVFHNIETENGTVANKGLDKQVTFTVMPGNEESFVIHTKVNDFEMDSIQINALPSSMSIETPDTDEMTEDMKTLSEATAEINNGVKELKNGITELHQGTNQLLDGSSEYKQGINDLDQGSTNLVDGSKSINQAIKEMSESLGNGSSSQGKSDFSQLQEGLKQMASGLGEAKDGLTRLSDQYAKAYQALDQSINAIPASTITKADIKKLYESNADQDVIEQLVNNYKASIQVKETYNQVHEAFKMVNPTLESVIESLTKMQTNLKTMSKELDQNLNQSGLTRLKEGLNQLSNEYQTFHSGLVEYTEGVSELASSYGDIHSGLSELNNGTVELKNGANQLYDGTSELASETSNLPGQMQEEIDQMVSQYDHSDFDPVSYVSSKNKNVTSVQFVIKTEGIKQEDNDKQNTTPKQEEDKGVWDRLVDLFR